MTSLTTLSMSWESISIIQGGSFWRSSDYFATCSKICLSRFLIALMHFQSVFLTLRFYLVWSSSTSIRSIQWWFETGLMFSFQVFLPQSPVSHSNILIFLPNIGNFMWFMIRYVCSVISISFPPCKSSGNCYKTLFSNSICS